MNSDRDGAPDYLRNNKKQSPLHLVGMLGIGFAITWGLIAFFDKPDVIDGNQLEQETSYSEPVQASEESQDFAPQIAQWPISREEVEWLEANKDSIVQEAQDAYNEDDYEHAAPAIR